MMCIKSSPFTLRFPFYFSGPNRRLPTNLDLVVKVDGESVTSMDNEGNTGPIYGTVADLRRAHAAMGKVLEAIDATNQVEAGKERLKSLTSTDNCAVGGAVCEAPKTY